MIKEFWVHFASFARQKWTTTFLTQRTPILKFITFANTATLSELETNSIYSMCLRGDLFYPIE